MTIDIALWNIPVFITVTSIVAAFFFVKEDKSSGFLSGVSAVFSLGLNLIVALVISLLSWVVYAIFFGAS